jgi:hypothetical protein
MLRRVSDDGWHEQAVRRHEMVAPGLEPALGEPVFNPYDESG